MRTIVPKVRNGVLVCLLALFSLQSQAQSISSYDGKFELGLGLGPSFFLGDLGGTRGLGKGFVKDVNFPLTKLMKGLYVNYYPAEWLGMRVAINHGRLEGDDAAIKTDGKNEMERKKRNLHFKSPLLEFYGALEIYPTVFFEQYDGLFHKLRPYGVIGFGMFHMNPKAQYIAPNGDKTWVPIQPLRLEGQGMAEYPDREQFSLWQQEIPMGFGFKYYTSDNMYIGLEILHRKSFTDYIDGVSTKYINPNLFNTYLDAQQATYARQLMYREQFYNPSVNRPYINQQRGDPTENDAYFSGMLRLGWRINGASSPNGRAKRQLKCPVFY
ncbi:MAG TPA: DUF6089 family protein [Chitinophagaceae bacterium]|jgi:hypothetical protein|nr:DUF6089 family protein [Chitinophagaceae bacterium]